MLGYEGGTPVALRVSGSIAGGVGGKAFGTWKTDENRLCFWRVVCYNTVVRGKRRREILSLIFRVGFEIFDADRVERRFRAARTCVATLEALMG